MTYLYTLIFFFCISIQSSYDDCACYDKVFYFEKILILFEYLLKIKLKNWLILYYIHYIL